MGKVIGSPLTELGVSIYNPITLSKTTPSIITLNGHSGTLF
jgi:hypothetical protein